MDASQIHGVGQGSIDRIAEILRTGTLKELEVNLDPKIKLILELTTISGVGESFAKKLVENFHIKSVDDLLTKFNAYYSKGEEDILIENIEENYLADLVNSFSHNILIGLKYVNQIYLNGIGT